MLSAAAFAVGVGACNGSSDEPETPADVLARGGSIARVTIATRTYDFEVTCYDAGAGSVIAVGTGVDVDPVTGITRDTRVFVQAFLGDSYVGVTVASPEAAAGAPGEEVYEAGLDDSFDLLLEDDVIASDDIQFVRNLDLTQGDGEPAGEGSLHVTCKKYEQGVPPGLER